jgi:hypothetical protein
MEKKWWFIGAGVIGIVLALLVFNTLPGTGDPTDSIKGKVTFDEAEASLRAGEAPVARMPDRGGATARLRPEALRRNVAKAPHGGLLVREDGVRSGGNPVSQALVASRSTPEGLYAGRAQAPFALIRRQLMLTEEADAKAMANQIGNLIADLRDMRRNPNPDGWDALENQMASWSDRIAHSDYAEEEHVGQSIERLEGILEEFHTAKEEQENAADDLDEESP